MEQRTILSKKEQLDRDIASNRSDDPFKLRYDFLLWLDTNFGKDKVKDIFISTLEETVNAHWNDIRYKSDSRLIQLQMVYADVQIDPLSVYQGYYDRGVARDSASLYIHWANQLESRNNYIEADKIFKLGLEKIPSTMKTELLHSFEKFLAKVGRKFLDGELTVDKGENAGPSCKCQTQPTSIPDPTPDAVVVWEMNPGKADCWDDFQTVVAYFDPPDCKAIRKYPKDKVYRDPGKEYSLEEIQAAEYFEKRKKNLEKQKLKEKPKMNFSESSVSEEAGCSKVGVFPTPLLPCSGKEESICAQSFTSRTKIALNLVQDMWSSPTPETAPPIIPKAESDRRKSCFSLFNRDNSETPKTTEKKTPVPSAMIFTDSVCETKEIDDNGPASIKRSGPSMDGLNTKSNVLFERKTLTTAEKADENRPIIKQQLQFDEDNANLLANKLSETTVSQNTAPFQPFGDFKPLYPNEPTKDDYSDLTCNTKAFNFELPSSTPVQQKKPKPPLPTSQSSFTTKTDESTYHTQQNLSVILEASKERCSSSDVVKQLAIDDFRDIDPFCPILNEKLLTFLNFPQSHHQEGYHLLPSNLPSITKQLRLGNDTFATFGDLGKGAYARIVKAVIDNTSVALKIEKPACKWEYYICKEIQKRVDPKMKSLFMDVKAAYIFFNASVLVMDWAKHGNLLDVINQYKRRTGKSLDQPLTFRFSIEIIKAVEFLHNCKIIHGDIKPDNFVLRSLPSLRENEHSLMLIDFGRSIDMTLFPEGTKFTNVVTTEGFQCNEMKEKLPWNYQTDLYGIAGTLYCVLASEYMKVVKKNDEWQLYNPLPRQVKRDLWNPIFQSLLNVLSCDHLPDLSSIRETLDFSSSLVTHMTQQSSFNQLSNVLLGK